MVNEWIFQAEFVGKILDADKVNSGAGGLLDVTVVRELDWDREIHYWSYGIRRFYVKDEVVAPE